MCPDKQIKFHFLLLFVGIIFLTSFPSCKEEIIVSFEIDGDRIKAGECPKDDSDYGSLGIMEAEVGETVQFEDVSSPERLVNSRFWDLNSDKTPDETEKKFTHNFDEPGLYQVTMCINGGIECIITCLYVRPKEEIQESETISEPTVFINKPDNFSETKRRTVTLEAEVTNVESEEEITITLNGDTIKGFLLEGNIVTAKVERLKRGENEIQIKAKTEGGMDEEKITINRTHEEPPEPPVSTSRPNPIPSGKLKITIPSNGFKTKKNFLTFQATVPSGTRKSDITVLLNEKKIKPSDLKISGGKAQGRVEGFYAGDNSLVIKAKLKEDEVSFNYIPSFQNVPNLSKSYTPPPASPPSQDCKEDVGTSFSITITPKQDIELLSFKLYTDICGGLEMVLSSSDGKQREKKSLNGGRSQISFGDNIDTRLKANQTYTLTCSSIKGYAGCQETERPHFEATKTSCGNPNPIYEHLRIDYQGRFVLYELNYLY